MFINIMSEPPLVGGSWIDDAQCKNHDSSLWILSENPRDRELNKSRFEQAEIICSTCPVITECWQSATHVDKLVTMRGGAWPEEYKAPAKRPRLGRPSRAAERPKAPPSPVCKRGHDTTDPESRTSHGQCKVCKRELENLRRAKKAGRLEDTERATA